MLNYLNLPTMHLAKVAVWYLWAQLYSIDNFVFLLMIGNGTYSVSFHIGSFTKQIQLTFVQSFTTELLPLFNDATIDIKSYLSLMAFCVLFLAHFSWHISWPNDPCRLLNNAEEIAFCRHQKTWMFLFVVCIYKLKKCDDCTYKTTGYSIFTAAFQEIEN